MIPILYESNETSFSSNGLGRLRDCISCAVVEERNGIYEVEFEYPVNGANFDKIQCGRIIGVTHDESGDIQPFDIVSYSRPIDGVVTFHAVHISYRQSKMVSYATGINTLADAFDSFDYIFFPDNPLGQDAGGNPFTYLTDKTSASGYCSAFDGTPRTIRSLLGGVEGSILDTYGGEYEWDKWFVRLHSARGEQRNFTIRYGVNLTEFQDDTDYSEVYNTCVPFWVNAETGSVVMGGEVSSGNSTIGVGDKCVPLDLTEKFEEQPSVAQLESMALDVMASHQSYLPSQSIKIDFVRLQDEAGYDQFDELLQCKLCDSVKVVFPYYNMSAYYKIVRTTWNVLMDRYDEMELGNLSTSLSEALGVGTSTSRVGGGGGGEGIHYGLRISGTEITLVEGGTTMSVTVPVPSKVSDLTNDSGYISTETDPTVPSWAKASTKPSYTASEVGAVPTTRTVNGHALSSNVTVTASDIGVESGAEVNQNAFSNIAVSGQTTVSADSKTDTLTLVAGSNVTIATNATNDSITISASGGGGGGSGTSVPTANATAAFDASKHMNSEDMSASDVSSFVDNLDLQGSGVVEYIIEQGTSGIWTYRKWNSGIAEAWAYQEGTANSSGDLSIALTCPNFFITSAQLNAVASGWGYGNAWGGVYHVHPMVSNGVWIVDTWIRNASANSLVGASWQVIGRWK